MNRYSMRCFWICLPMIAISLQHMANAQSESVRLKASLKWMIDYEIDAELRKLNPAVVPSVAVELLPLFERPNSTLRWRVLSLFSTADLSTHPSSDTIAKAVFKQLECDQPIRKLAIEVLVDLGEPATSLAKAGIDATPESFNPKNPIAAGRVRAASAEVLRQQKKLSLEATKRLAKDSDPRVRAVVAKASSMWREAVPTLLELLTDPEIAVGLIACEQLGTMDLGEMEQQAVDAILNACDLNHEMRPKATKSLSKMNSDVATLALKELNRKARVSK